MPRTARRYRVAVVRIESRKGLLPGGAEKEPLPKAASGSWPCAVASSDHSSHPVCGHRIAAELARGRQISLDGDRASC